MGIVLKSGGNWYLSVADEKADQTATGCFVAALIYGGYLVFCGFKVMRIVSENKAEAREALLEQARMD